jgi:hypothetical protein
MDGKLMYSALDPYAAALLARAKEAAYPPFEALTPHPHYSGPDLKSVLHSL